VSKKKRRQANQDAFFNKRCKANDEVLNKKEIGAKADNPLDSTSSNAPIQGLIWPHVTT
jgi:hypothetical protein